MGVNNIGDESVCDDSGIQGLVVGPCRNQEEMIEELDLADNLFFGGHCKLVQWSVSQKKVTKDYGDVMVGYILSMVRTSDKKHVFVSDM